MTARIVSSFQCSTRVHEGPLIEAGLRRSSSADSSTRRVHRIAMLVDHLAMPNAHGSPAPTVPVRN